MARRSPGDVYTCSSIRATCIHKSDDRLRGLQEEDGVSIFRSQASKFVLVQQSSVSMRINDEHFMQNIEVLWLDPRFVSGIVLFRAIMGEQRGFDLLPSIHSRR